MTRAHGAKGATLAALSAMAMAACGGADDASPAASDEDELRELAITLSGTDDATVQDKPALKPGAKGSFACADRFDADDRSRLGCARGDEVLEVIRDSAAKTALLVYRPKGRGVDTRSFYTCTSSAGAGASGGDHAEKLACVLATPSSSSGHGGLASPFASTVPGIDVPNAHTVGTGELLLRGMAPRSAADYDQLLGKSVAAVLVFKNETGGHDVEDELTELGRRDLPDAQRLAIPFKWKDIGAFQTPCEETIEALSFLAQNVAAKRGTYFHCTVGEDRTGLLAAMHRLVNEPDLDAAQAFDMEMCERGYAAGNPLKPAFVVRSIDDGLTPLYRKMAYLVAKGTLRKGALDASVCATDPEGAADFASKALPLERLHCGTSTRFAP